MKYCYLCRVVRSEKLAIKRALAVHPDVVRIIDHGPHIKISMAKGRPPQLDGMGKLVRVRDQTTHVDAIYWDYAMSAFRRAILTQRDPYEMLGIMTHYLFNLAGSPYDSEPLWLAKMGLARADLEARVTDEMVHGWEFDALRGKPKFHVKRVRTRWVVRKKKPKAK